MQDSISFRWTKKFPLGKVDSHPEKKKFPPRSSHPKNSHIKIPGGKVWKSSHIKKIDVDKSQSEKKLFFFNKMLAIYNNMQLNFKLKLVFSGLFRGWEHVINMRHRSFGAFFSTQSQ